MNNENKSDQQYIGESFTPPQPGNTTHPQRVIHQIPVQHLNPLLNSNTSSGSLPTSHNFLRDRDNNSPFNRHQDRFNTSLFDDPFFADTDYNLIDRPFTNININRNPRLEADPRFTAPFASRFDDFFRPRPETEFVYRNNSPARDYLNPIINNTRSHSQPRSTPPPKEQQQQTQEDKKEQSPITVTHNTEKSSDSPKRFTTQTTIYPNQTAGGSPSNTTNINPVQQQPTQPIYQNLHNNPGIPIKIEHLLPTASPNSFANKSDFKYESDFGNQRQSTPPDSTNKMGTTMSNAPNTTNNKPPPTKINVNDFTGQSKSTGVKQEPQKQQSPQAQPIPKTVKTPQEKCDEIKLELERLEKDVDSFNGKNGDRGYLMLDELITRCLLRLDEVEKGDDAFNQYRKGLIKIANTMSDRLESKCDAKEACSTDSQVDKQNEQSKEELNSNLEQTKTTTNVESQPSEN